MSELIVVGLGAGRKGLMTEETKRLLTEEKCVRLRTAKHPTVTELGEEGYTFSSFDHIYDEKDTFDEVYTTITDECLALAKAEVFEPKNLPALTEQKASLLRERRAILEGLGIEEAQLFPQYTCEKCSDTGFLPSGVACNCYKPN